MEAEQEAEQTDEVREKHPGQMRESASQQPASQQQANVICISTGRSTEHLSSGTLAAHYLLQTELPGKKNEPLNLQGQI